MLRSRVRGRSLLALPARRCSKPLAAPRLTLSGPLWFRPLWLPPFCCSLWLPDLTLPALARCLAGWQRGRSVHQGRGRRRDAAHAGVCMCVCVCVCVTKSAHAARPARRRLRTLRTKPPLPPPASVARARQAAARTRLRLCALGTELRLGSAERREVCGSSAEAARGEARRGEARRGTRSGHQSRKGRENIPVAGTNRGRGERIYP
eukprot:1186941-Prorocentrum_minimum.AAC.1